MSPAREIAFRVLLRVSEGGFATDLLRHETAEARDIALAETIVLGCLRYQAQLDFLIAEFSGKSGAKLDPEVSIALRMGIFQLRFLDRIPPYAAVADSVDLVKMARKKSASGYVNAVLRRVHTSFIKWPDMATELSVPPWLLERWKQHYGEEAAEGIARAALEEPNATFNTATGRRQDLSAQSIVPLLQIKPGMHVLDVCAAPGNKTAQMLALGAHVIACDRSFKRLEAVPAEAERVLIDGSIALPFTARFDRILLDAPCSGTGTLGRNPEIKWRLKPEDLPRLAHLQRQMLAQSLPCLKPGGRLVYSTCSLEKEENEDVVAAFSSAFEVPETHVRRPGRDPGDGFFAAVITS